MRSHITIALVSALVLLVANSSARAASYQQTGGTIIDPIQLTGGGAHPYAGPNLEPFASIPFANLGDADLSSADLFTADLTDADLPSTDLSSADLTNATPVNVVLSFANLTNANLTNANLSTADLSFANLSNTNLSSTNLSMAILLSADLSLANLSGADFTGADLSFSFNLASTFWAGVAPIYDGNTDFTGTGFNAYAAGWTAVPEPGMLLLIKIGVLGLAVGARHRMQRFSNMSAATVS